MVKKRVIPCLDVAAGRVVKGVNFVDLRDVGDPVELAHALLGAGADELVFLDITATLEERRPIVDVIAAASPERLTIPFTVGGGVTDVDDARRSCSRGADKVAVNSAAFDDPTILTQPRRGVRLAGRRRRDRRARRRGRDARRADADADAMPSTGPARRSSVARARSCSPRSTRTEPGPGTTSTLTRAVVDAVDVPVIASGGAGEAPPSRRGVRDRRRGGADRVDRARATRAAAGAEGRAEGDGMEHPEPDPGGDRAGRRAAAC